MYLIIQFHKMHSKFVSLCLSHVSVCVFSGKSGEKWAAGSRSRTGVWRACRPAWKHCLSHQFTWGRSTLFVNKFLYMISMHYVQLKNVFFFWQMLNTILLQRPVFNILNIWPVSLLSPIQTVGSDRRGVRLWSRWQSKGGLLPWETVLCL